MTGNERDKDIIASRPTTGGPTGGDVARVDGTGDVVNEEDETVVETGSVTPEQKARQRYHESQKKYYDSKKELMDRLKFIATSAAWFAGFAATILTLFYAYQINNIAEPVGGLKEAVDTIKSDILELNDNVDEIEDYLWPKTPREENQNIDQ